MDAIGNAVPGIDEALLVVRNGRARELLQSIVDDRIILKNIVGAG